MRLNNEFYIRLRNNANDYTLPSASDVINILSVLNHSSEAARAGTEQIVASPSNTHLTSLGYS